MPDADPLIDKFHSLKERYFNEYFTKIDHNRRFYNREFGSEVVPERWSTRMPPLIPQTSRRSVDENADHILYIPHIKVPLRPTTSHHITEREIAENKRAFLNAFWSQVSYRFNPLGDGRKPFLREGKIVVRHSLRWDMIPERKSMTAAQYKAALDKLGRYDFLWKDELLDNTTVYEDPSDHRDPKYVYVEYDVNVEDAKVMVPEATGDWTLLDDYETVKYLEYWTKPAFKPDGSFDPGKFIQWIEEERVNEEENPYPYIPIAIEDAGFGDNYRGVKPIDKYVGIAQHSTDMFIAEAQQMTAWNTASGMIAFPPTKAWNMDETRVINIGPGGITHLNGDKGQPGAEDFEFAQWPEVPQAVLALVDKTTQYANAALKMDTLSGMPLRGVDTATEADQQIRNAASKLEGPLAGMSRLVVRISRWVLMDIELVLKTGVTIYGTKSIDPEVVSLAPKDIKGYYDVSAEFTTTDADAISQMKARFWGEMYRTIPFLSAMSAMERGQIADDPMAEMQKRAAEDILLSPEMRQIRLMTAAQQYGQLSEMVNAISQGAGESGGATEPVPGANSAEGLLQQPNPEQQLTFDQSLEARDVMQGDKQIL